MKDWFQLCPKTEDTCSPLKVKSADEYANDLCHKYRYRYPTLLSGRGRQLSPRNGNDIFGLDHCLNSFAKLF